MAAHTTDGSAGAAAVVSAESSGRVAADQLSRRPLFTLPDFLRPVTIQVYAPYRPLTVDLVAGAPSLVLPPNPMRVGLVITVPSSPGNLVKITTTDAPTGHALWLLGSLSTQTAMIADYFSVCMAGLTAVSLIDVTLSVVEFVRPV